MLFNTTQFFVFLIVVLILFYASPTGGRKWILLAASYFFYGSWNPKFIPLLLVLTVIDYTAAVWISRAKPARRKTALILSLCANLGFLGFFKYYNFLAEMTAALLRMPPHTLALSIVLPLGISFHTFQSMSYVIDVYRGEQAAITNPLDYALFISFFPQLVAGPIVRAREFFGDLFRWRPPTGEDVARGIFLVMLGLTKKMALADQFAQVADAYFRNVSGHPGALTAWSGVLAFGLQIFFDFSGYTDMAIGMALLFGFHFPVNFRRPYLAASITEFWRRWHISLSRWLRDYLYIPLGGNRHGDVQTYRNLMLTMLLGGLWHGASWNFVMWGGYHGALLGVERWVRSRRPNAEPVGWLYPFKAAATFALVLVGWVFFRASNLAESWHIIREMFTGGRGTVLLNAWQWGLAGISLLLAVAEEKYDWLDRLALAPGWAYAGGLTAILLCLELLGVTDVSIPFIYFQF